MRTKPDRLSVGIRVRRAEEHPRRLISPGPPPRAPQDEMKLLAKGGKTFEGGQLVAYATPPADEPAPTPSAPAAAPDVSVEATATPESSAPVRPDKPGPPGSNTRFNKIVDALTNRLNNLIQNDTRLSPPLVALPFLIAALMGAVHAFTPGHGKTVMAAYLIGERGTILHALMLGLVVTLTHVWSILVLGVISLYLTEYRIVSDDLHADCLAARGHARIDAPQPNDAQRLLRQLRAQKFGARPFAIFDGRISQRDGGTPPAARSW